MYVRFSYSTEGPLVPKQDGYGGQQGRAAAEVKIIFTRATVAFRNFHVFIVSFILFIPDFSAIT